MVATEVEVVSVNGQTVVTRIISELLVMVSVIVVYLLLAEPVTAAIAAPEPETDGLLDGLADELLDDPPNTTPTELVETT